MHGEESDYYCESELLFDDTVIGFRVNVGCGPAEERLLLTGLHAVADIYCENCHTTLGWKYVSMYTCTHAHVFIQSLADAKLSIRFHPLMAPLVALNRCIPHD